VVEVVPENDAIFIGPLKEPLDFFYIVSERPCDDVAIRIGHLTEGSF
jgi:hypothetical protein